MWERREWRRGETERKENQLRVNLRQRRGCDCGERWALPNGRADAGGSSNDTSLMIHPEDGTAACVALATLPWPFLHRQVLISIGVIDVIARNGTIDFIITRKLNGIIGSPHFQNSRLLDSSSAVLGALLSNLWYLPPVSSARRAVQEPSAWVSFLAGPYLLAVMPVSSELACTRAAGSNP